MVWVLTLILLGLVGSPASADLGADSKLLLLFVKLRPNKTRSKMHVYDLATQWAAEVKPLIRELNVVDKDNLVATASSQELAVQAKDYFLAQESIYEVEFNQDSQGFRREGDVPIEELRRSLGRAASEKRRKERERGVQHPKGGTGGEKRKEGGGMKVKRRRRKGGAPHGAQRGRLERSKPEL